MIGRTISHYTVLEKLGEGAMGVVYKALDMTLNRPVALKFISPQLQTSADSFQRFLREARSASALNHPNILTIYGFEERSGESFIATEWVEGRTLKSAVGTASIPEIISYAAQIASGLSKAHASGIIHRDIKTDNIMVTSDGVIKVMDFGLAKLKGEMSLTGTGTTVGTIAYLSPEQLQGGDASEQSDIWSFGVVLYELVAGRLPFHAAHEAATMYEIVNVDPAPVRELRSDCPHALNDIVTSMLAKDPARRYRRVDDVLQDVNKLSTTAVHSGQQPAGVGPRKKQRVLPAVASGLGILLVAVIGYIASHWLKAGEGQTPAAMNEGSVSVQAIAVLPFLNLSPEKENEYFGDGITEETITTLSQVPALRVIPLTTVLTYKGTKQSIDQIANVLHVRYVLEGSVRKSGADIRISTRLIDVPAGKTLWVRAFNDHFEKIFEIQQQVANEIASALSIHLASVTGFGRRYAPDANAYAYYLQGMFFRRKFDRRGLDQASELFQKAVAKDSGFADAYVQLASVYASFIDLGYSTDTLLLMRADSLLAVARRFNPDFSPFELVTGFVADLREDHLRAERYYRAGIQKDSSVWYGQSLLGWLLRDEGREEEAIRFFDGALRADPTVFTPLAGKASALAALGRYPEAMRAIHDARAIEPANTFVLNTEASILLQQMMIDSAHSVIEQSLRADGTKLQTNGLKAQVLAARGDCSRARQFIARASLLPQRSAADSYVMAAYYALCNEPDSSRLSLERAAALGFSRDALMQNDRRFSTIQQHPYFLQVVSRAAKNRMEWIRASAAP